MIKVNHSNAVREYAEMATKLAKGYETLQNIEQIDVATTPKELVWKQDKVQIYRYSRNEPATIKTPVLVTYALVNRQDMMDIQPDRSYIKNLLDLGLDIYMIDWGYPTAADKYLTLDDYVNGYMNEAVDFVCEQSGQPKVNLMGICQGGTLSLIYSAIYPEKVKNLITLVTPVDFSTNDGLLFRWAKDMDIDKIVDTYGNVPGDFLNSGFAQLKPMSRNAKFISAINLMDNEEKILNFLRMEKWISDSPDQAGECYRQFLKDLYQQNKLIKGTLQIGGYTVNLKNITMPVLNIYAEEDNLVPPAASIPLNDLIGSKDATLYKFKGGHIGVFVGSRSQKELAPAVATWLKERDKK
ncbi:class III poly(R)-hydroxyalkanoic acid synthase subunit PhaC [Adhaeribacter soli]|uniref:Poly(3-hydroxyalkanoate) polymerase subunit PhaC n=1 Tax=Adhaeribacter soli TaxID=2607655 RepID=A0A5N1J9R9_9BACT|nr:class III poly(R)-hydroxyalkanoic acid synthase subunit PhaC [Adhaeribacter soli]KAA9345748.1 class III poly(R)-hydroxyalkanoic acid synthase subunit PhaC [Adhaeribacter soli]